MWGPFATGAPWSDVLGVWLASILRPGVLLTIAIIVFVPLFFGVLGGVFQELIEMLRPKVAVQPQSASKTIYAVGGDVGNRIFLTEEQAAREGLKFLRGGKAGQLVSVDPAGFESAPPIFAVEFSERIRQKRAAAVLQKNGTGKK